MVLSFFFNSRILAFSSDVEIVGLAAVGVPMCLHFTLDIARKDTMLTKTFDK